MLPNLLRKHFFTILYEVVLDQRKRERGREKEREGERKRERQRETEREEMKKGGKPLLVKINYQKVDRI